MAKRTEGATPLTLTQRQAAHRQRRADLAMRWKAALQAIQTAK